MRSEELFYFVVFLDILNINAVFVKGYCIIASNLLFDFFSKPLPPLRTGQHISDFFHTTEETRMQLQSRKAKQPKLKAEFSMKNIFIQFKNTPLNFYKLQATAYSPILLDFTNPF